VAILMGDRPELLDVYYGTLWAGPTVVPLYARLGKDGHRHILEDSGAKVVCHDEKMAGRVADVAVGAGPEHLVSVDASSPVGERPLLLADLQARQPDGPGRPEVSPGDRAGLFSTVAPPAGRRGWSTPTAASSPPSCRS
jgi:fatty-acyl-CoA synthase